MYQKPLLLLGFRCVAPLYALSATERITISDYCFAQLCVNPPQLRQLKSYVRPPLKEVPMYELGQE